MKPVELCKIEKLIPVFKNGVEAERIQVAKIETFNGESCQFDIIVGKGLYNIGDSVIYIMPDYCLSDKEIFSEYLRPGGDESKCRLGKRGRIRALKFNFQFENSSDPIYSNGIIVPPIEECIELIQKAMVDPEIDLQKEFGIIKYVAEDSFESQKSGLTQGEFPSFLYKTDETRCELLKGHIDKCFDENEILGFTLKRDGCLDENVLIETEKDGFLTIKQMCEMNFNGNVKSFNIENETVEYKKVLGTSIKDNINNWFEIVLEDNTVLIVTGNHTIWLPELMCYRRVDELDGTEHFLIHYRRNLKIKSINKIDNQSKRYDIEVKDNNNFFANNILVHNSSCTIACRLDPISTEKVWNKHICTRSQEKKLDQQYVSGYKDIDGVLLHPFTKKEIIDGILVFKKGWMNDSTTQFYTDENVIELKLKPVITEVRDAWVDTVDKFGYLVKFLEYCQKYNVQLALRGELIGAGNKGSGNKLNTDAKTGESRIVWFGIDDLSSGHSVRIHYDQEHNLKKVCEELGFEFTEELWEGTFNYGQIISKCNEFFKRTKEETGRVVEGVVVRSKYSNRLSTKFINNEYDSKS